MWERCAGEGSGKVRPGERTDGRAINWVVWGGETGCQ